MIVGHLSDIHIRLYARHPEYREVFSNLYRWIDDTLLPLQREGKEVVLVLTGDILHNKIELTPECILVTLEFFQELARRLPTLVIAGNHDALLNNRDRIDSLTAVLRDRTIPGLYYLKDTGVYPFGGVAFHVLSLLDPLSDKAEDVSKWYRDSLSMTLRKNVALFHGGVGRYRLQNNFYHDSNIPLSSFDGYDAVMLGDIHLHQFLSPTIAYAGSLISQNAGETDPCHGVLVWDLDATTTQYHIIPNPWAYTTLSVCPSNKTCIWKGQSMTFPQLSDNKEFPSRGRIRVQLQTTVKMVVKETTQQLQHMFPHAVWTVNADNANNTNNTSTLPSTTLHHTTTSSPQNLMEAWLHTPEQFLQEYLTTLGGGTPMTKVPESVLQTFRTKCLEAFTARTRPSSRWKILRVEWDHLFGYGERQSIDLESLPPRGVATLGVFGPNSSGKSTLIDILTFMLFNKITRWAHGVSIPSEVIHVRSNKGTGSVLIECGESGMRYRVVKTLTRAPRSGKITLKEEVWEVDKGTGKDLRAVHLEQKRQTDSWLRSHIGEYDAFLFLSICLQRLDRSSFRDMTQKERKEKFFRHFHLDFLESSSICEEWEIQLRDVITQCIRLEDRVDHVKHISVEDPNDAATDWEQRREDLSKEKAPWETKAQEIRNQISEGERWIQQETEIRSSITTLETSIRQTQEEKNKLLSTLPTPVLVAPPLWTEVETVERKTLHEFLTEQCEHDHPPSPYECRAADPAPFRKNHWIPACPAEIPCGSCKRNHRTTTTGSKSNTKSTETMTTTCSTMNDWMKKASSMIRNRIRSRLWDFPTDLMSDTGEWVPFSATSLSGIVGLRDMVNQIDKMFQSLQEQQEDLSPLEIRYKHLEHESRMVRGVLYNLDCTSCRDNPFRLRGKEQQESIDALQEEIRQKKTAIQTLMGQMISIMQLYVVHVVDIPNVPNVPDIPDIPDIPSKSRWTRLTQSMTSVDGIEEVETMYRKLLGLQERVEQEEAAAANYQLWETLYKERQVVVTRMHEEFLTVCREDEARYQTYREAWTAYESYRKTREERHTRYKQLESLWERKEAWTRQQRVRDLEARLDELERDKAVKRNEHRDILRYRVEQDAQEKQLHHILQQLEVIQEKRIALEVEKRSMEVKKEERAARIASREKDQRDLSTLLERRDLLEFLVKKVFHRDGFPLFMLRKLIGEFESRLETILEPFFPSRKLRLQIDETGTSIHMRIENTVDGTTMPNLFLGGMEGLMVDVGMKVVWNMISTEPRCNLFILDENISVLDQGHLQNLRHIFEFLEQHFDHILVISHLEIVKDFVHGCIRTTVDPETNKRSLTLVT